MAATVQLCAAGSATWKSNAGNGDWNQATNWRPQTVPNGSGDTASFISGNQTVLSLSAAVEVNGIAFNPGASAFSVTVPPLLTLTISGVGVTNASSVLQNFKAAVDVSNNHGSINFTSNSSAGTDCVLSADGQAVSGDLEAGIQFSDNSTAGSSTVINNGSPSLGFRGGRTRFINNANAGNGTFINLGCPIADSGYGEGATVFLDSSNAATGFFTNEAATVSGALGGATFFEGSSSAANGTFIQKGAAESGALGGRLNFEDSSTAGTATFVNNSGSAIGDASEGEIIFRDSSTAGNGNFTNDGSAVSANVPPTIIFEDNSTAGNAVLTSQGGTISNGAGGIILFVGNASAENATITTNGTAVEGAFGSIIEFFSSSTAGSATFILNGGTAAGISGARMELLNDSSGGSARLEVFGNATFDISLHNPAPITLGSIEGDGSIFLGAMLLEIGHNDLSTNFSGVIADGGQGGGVGGGLSKEGTGTLTLSGASTYSGGTSVDGGILVVANKDGSATGTGALSVNQGTLAGTGKIAGPVRLGNGIGEDAFLAPGINGTGKLTVQKSLRFLGRATYLCEIDTKRTRADSVSATGITILSDTTFSLMAIGNRPVSLGTIFTVIDNRSHNQIDGSFGNLLDGAIISVGNNNYEVSYSGGDGNDLTLTVVPRS